MSEGNPTGRELRIAADLLDKIDDMAGAVRFYVTAGATGLKVQVTDDNLEGFRVALTSLSLSPTAAHLYDDGALHIHAKFQRDGVDVDLYAPLHGMEQMAGRAWLAEQGISWTVPPATTADAA